MKNHKVSHNQVITNRCQEHLEWDDENEATEKELHDVGKCITTLVIGSLVVLSIIVMIVLL